MTCTIQHPEIVAKAYARIKDYVHKTPLWHSDSLNEKLGSQIYFKLDSMQKTGAFKIRGVLNNLLSLKELGKLPSKIVAYSTGNHAIAMSYAAKLFDIKARVYLPKNVAPVKKRIAESYGAEIIEVATRKEAEQLSNRDGKAGYHYLPPSDDDATIAGAGTMCYEALVDMIELGKKPDAIFAPCGGGGLLSGTYLAKELLSPNSEVHGVEPKLANDAYLSLTSREIFKFKDAPETVADGLTTPSVPARTLHYLKKLDDFHLIEEEEIRHWASRITEMTKVTCEPSAAISMAAAHSWIQTHGKDKVVLVLITGGNVDI
ncbi:MAG: serine/threonine dehydratase [Rickettsiales bacterium]|nr:MAG: serine/threonine dehydratase [Rickettsiales bacterium]